MLRAMLQAACLALALSLASANQDFWCVPPHFSKEFAILKNNVFVATVAASEGSRCFMLPLMHHLHLHLFSLDSRSS